MNRKPLVALIALCTFASTSSALDWEAAANFPGLGRHHPITFAIDGYGYLATGSTTAGSSVSDDFFRYDPVANSWEVLPDFPGTDRSYGYGGAFGGKGYLGFGAIGATYLNDLWEYDPQTLAWTQLASLPGVGRTHPAFVVTDAGKIFVGMGGGVAGNLRDWWEYDIAGNSWTQKADLPGAQRHHPYYFNIGNIPYAGFGHGAGIFKDIYRFDPVSGLWTRMTDFPSEGRVAGTQFSWNGKGYVASGEGTDHNQFPTGEFWEYDPTLDSWSALTPHPGESRWAPGTFMIDNTVYLMGGLTNTLLESSMWKYRILDPAGVSSGSVSDANPFVLFPNPVLVGSDPVLNFASAPSFTSALEGVRLLNVQGREIAGVTLSSNSLRLSDGLLAGQYYVSFSMKNGARHTRSVTVLR